MLVNRGFRKIEPDTDSPTPTPSPSQNPSTPSSSRPDVPASQAVSTSGDTATRPRTGFPAASRPLRSPPASRIEDFVAGLSTSELPTSFDPSHPSMIAFQSRMDIAMRAMRRNLLLMPLPGDGLPVHEIAGSSFAEQNKDFDVPFLRRK
jgi:hypothetical protein